MEKKKYIFPKPKKGFQMLSKELISEIGLQAAYLISLLGSVSEGKQSPTFYLSDSEIMKMTGWSKKTVYNWVKILEEHNLLVTKTGTNNKKQIKAKQYTLCINNIEASYNKESLKNHNMPNFVCNVEGEVEIMKHPQAHFDEAEIKAIDAKVFYKTVEEDVFHPSYDETISNVMEMK